MAATTVLRVRNLSEGDPVPEACPEMHADYYGSASLPDMLPSLVPGSAPADTESFQHVLTLPPLSGAWPISTARRLAHPTTFPQLSPNQPLMARLNKRSRVFLHRLSTANAFGANAKAPAPTFVKTFPSRPMLPVKIYIPPPGNCQPGRLPLYVHVAPTSFLRTESATAAETERFCARLAIQHGICVASVPFRSPPRWMYPTQVYDVVSILGDLLAGKDLPIHRRRIAIGGFGAGASVALSVVQTKEMRGVIRGVLAICPIVDWTVAGREKLESVERPRDVEPNSPEEKAAEVEDRRVEKLYDLTYWSYVPPREDLTNPRLSPAFVRRERLPRHIFLIGAQHDMLCAEAEKMALRLAAETFQCTIGNDDAWDAAGIKWEKVPGWTHTFAFRPEKGDREIERQLLTADMFDRVGDWLLEKVFG